MKWGLYTVFFLALGVFGIVRINACSGDYAFRIPGYHSYKYTPEKYKETLDWVTSKNNKNTKKYNAASTGMARLKVLEKVDNDLLKIIDTNLFPFWYGTDYYFFGESQTPGQGKTSCGHFVTTILKDAGFVLDRRKLAQYPSEMMIKHMVAPEHIHRFSNVKLTDFLKEVQRLGDGLYVTGLDTHSGFTLNKDGNVFFIHASGRYPNCVLKEAAFESKVLKASKYRVLGKLSGNNELLTRWVSRDSLVLPAFQNDSIR